MIVASLPLVSIVTPVYNGAEYLVECIESILSQTYQNWEYTIVDNCSKDRSVEIARAYAAKDPRIRIHENQEFLQAIPNHNAALRQISPASKYCKVVFADDWIFPECLERMVAAGEEHPTAGIVGAYALEGDQVICTGLPYPSSLVSGREICRQHFLRELYVFGSANSLLYRADLVRSHDPFYNESNIHADTEVCFALLNTCDFAFVHQVLTFTRLRPGSLSTISSDINTDSAGMLHILQTHGPDYLTPEELHRRLKDHISAYYGFLGKSLIFGRNKSFWDYHKRKLTEAGVGFSRTRLFVAMVAKLCAAALNPKDTIEKLRQRSMNRKLANRKHDSESMSPVIPPQGDATECTKRMHPRT